MEHRWYQRIETDLPADLILFGRVLPCRISNFSVGGLFIRGRLELNLNQFVEVRVPINPTGAVSELHRIRGLVVHLYADGAGILSEDRVPCLTGPSHWIGPQPSDGEADLDELSRIPSG